jgi:hypothetical protein
MASAPRPTRKGLQSSTKRRPRRRRSFVWMTTRIGAAPGPSHAADSAGGGLGGGSSTAYPFVFGRLDGGGGRGGRSLGAIARTTIMRDTRRKRPNAKGTRACRRKRHTDARSPLLFTQWARIDATSPGHHRRTKRLRSLRHVLPPFQGTPNTHGSACSLASQFVFCTVRGGQKSGDEGFSVRYVSEAGDTRRPRDSPPVVGRPCRATEIETHRSSEKGNRVRKARAQSH